MEEKANPNVLKSVLKGFSQGVIAYYKIYAEITGSVTAALLLSQIAYWWYGPAAERPFYKTNREFTVELVMGLAEFKAAKKLLVLKGLIEIKRRGVPQKSYYKFNETAILAKISSWSKIDQLIGRKSTNERCCLHL